ncbi:type III PLP-dependent enzyme [Aspergillus foveolatus]|uniref:type III PLP-dependent enzyme n=1 Tax=Aspergillus foveolatus TaxID=210207 RepID=UPI003CCCF3B6
MSFCSADTQVQSPGYWEPSPAELVDLAIERHIAYLENRSLERETEPFFVADLGQVTRQHTRWMRHLPNVRPYYAVKCNSDPTLLAWLAGLGTGFDCASTEELYTVLSLNIDPARIIFSNPCKAPAALIFARQVGVTRMTFDNLDELDKICTYIPEAQLLLRTHASDDSALIPLGDKFGAHLDTTKQLLLRAWDLGLNVAGVSFHIGTGARNPECFRQAIHDAHSAFSHAETIGFRPTILDIGGGFQDGNFESMARAIREAFSARFSPEITVIAEPGRYYARSAYTLVSQVIGRRRQIGSAAASGIPDMLYQNDGVYGNFMNVVMEKEVMLPRLCGTRRKKAELLGKSVKQARSEVTQPSAVQTLYSIWGPTCDSVDCVVRAATFNSEIKVGDWLRYDNMGAYTRTTATSFNGFGGTSAVYYVNSEVTPAPPYFQPSRCAQAAGTAKECA